MFLNNYKNLIKIFLVLVFALLASSFSVKNIFLANSPKIRPNLGGYLMAKVNNAKDNILARLNFNFLPSFTAKTELPIDEPQVDTFAENQSGSGAIDFLKESLKPITKGVNASSKDGYSYTEFTLNEIEWAQINYILSNGETVTIQYPKGTKPPPQEVVEAYGGR